MRTYYLLLVHPETGRISIRKQKGKSYQDARKRYHGSAEHFRTEATVLSTHSTQKLATKEKKKYIPERPSKALRKEAEYRGIDLRTLIGC